MMQITISFNKPDRKLPKKLKQVLEQETTQSINTEVMEYTQGSEFLQFEQGLSSEEGDADIFSSNAEASSGTGIAYFDRREVKMGLHLGQGTFSDVYEVTSFKLKSSSMEKTGSITSYDRARTYCEQATKEAVEAGGPCKYAIKIPKHPERKEFFRRSKKSKKSASDKDGEGEPIKFQEYTRACIDLIMEGKYLAAMDHPNIIKVRGLASGPSPFIIVDYLDTTLDKRIDQWRRGSTAGPVSSASRSPRRWSSLRRSSSMQQSFPAGGRTKSFVAPFRRCSTTEADMSAAAAAVATGSPTLAMDFLEERTSYALQIAEALKYLHRHRIIVRDLKPSNIGFMKRPDGDRSRDMIKLFDFGLCRELPEPSTSRTPGDYDYTEDDSDCFRMSVAGTLRFMAPEIINIGVYGLKADVYSWSIVSYELLTLERPYEKVCATPQLHRRFVCRDGIRPIFPPSHKQLDARTNPWVPVPLQKIVERSWAQKPNDRPSIEEVCTQLKTLMTEFGMDDSSSPSSAASSCSSSSSSSSPPRSSRSSRLKGLKAASASASITLQDALKLKRKKPRSITSHTA